MYLKRSSLFFCFSSMQRRKKFHSARSYEKKETCFRCMDYDYIQNVALKLWYEIFSAWCITSLTYIHTYIHAYRYRALYSGYWLDLSLFIRQEICSHCWMFLYSLCNKHFNSLHFFSWLFFFLTAAGNSEWLQWVFLLVFFFSFQHRDDFFHFYLVLSTSFSLSYFILYEDWNVWRLRTTMMNWEIVRIACCRY